MPAPTEIIDLINRFKNQYDSYHSPSYNETQLRREFVDPFFKTLGWDVDNEQGYAEAYKDVIHEDSILKGSFDKYAQSTKRKRGTAEVDDAFLGEIEQWRSDLARNLALRNPELSQRELNVAVQKTIDRIIFLRICEDRGIEQYGQLQSLLNGLKTYARMCELFRRADERYNSGLSHFSQEKDRAEPPDEWTLSLAIDDRVLKDIIRRLYYPESPYEFSVLGADILGQVYEQFLGKVIRLTKGHQAKVEDKPEVKKAGGVYYTPTYIVDCIVKQTVGKLLEGKQPHEVAARTKTTWKPSKRGRPLSVLDPACGSGSFLIGAYQYLLDKGIDGKYNSAMFFIERMVSLCATNGRIGVITDISFYEHFYDGVKKYLLDRTQVNAIVNGLSSFLGVGSGQVIIIATKSAPSENGGNTLWYSNGIDGTTTIVDQRIWDEASKCYQFFLPSGARREAIIAKCREHATPLGELFPNKLIRTGESVGVKEAGFVIEESQHNGCNLREAINTGVFEVDLF